MRLLIIKLIGDIWNKFNYRVLLLIVLMVLNGLMEGIGFALFLPLLTIIGFGENRHGPLSYIFERLFFYLKIFPTIEILISIIILVFFIQNIFFISQSCLSSRLQNDYVALWRDNLFSKCINAKWLFFTKHKAGELANVIVGETFRLSGLFYQVSQLLSSFAVTSVLVFLSFIVACHATLLLLATGLVIFFITRGLIKKVYHIGNEITVCTNDLQTATTELLGSSKLIKISSTEEFARLKFMSIVNRLKRLFFWGSLHPTLLKGLFELSAISLLCLLLFVGTKYFKIDPAAILVMIAILVRLIPKFFGFQLNFQLLAIYLPAINSVMRLEGTANDYFEVLDSSRKDRALFEGRVEISLDNVTVFVDEREILRNITMSIPAGKTIAIVGSSGSGKTMLVDSILKLFEANSGFIKINNLLLNQLHLRDWRQSIGYVSQETYLFHDTIRNNIMWGNFNVSENSIIESAKRAYAHDFIIELSSGYETIIGDHGVRLSGGQRQRIGLTRALLKQPSVLILDEATNALDSESEAKVMKTIEELHGKMTIIIIAHRLSALRSADYIYVLEKGEIIEHGVWEQLLKQKDRFSYLWELQTK